MRALHVPVRLAVTVVALAAAAGCMSVGDDGERPGPSHSAGRRAGEAPGDEPAAGVGGVGSRGGKGGHGGKGKAKPGESASGDPSASASESASGKPSAKATEKGGKPSAVSVPPGEPTPTRTTEEPSPEPPPPPSPAEPDPGPAEPSSSAHEQQATQLVQREPAPEAGSPV
ncbi:hypothetical protein [Streptomyces sp. NPDC002580]|uniref:hypothetical protein n=1 Tax=Streptomyces sp. NPDC002580 TaxID=3364653 RepID=UPI0036B0DFC5